MAKAKKQSSEAEVVEAVKVEYWQGNIFIPGIGTVSGEANPDHVKAFDKLTSKVATLNRSNYLGDQPMN